MNVILYSTNCPKCQVLEKKLDSAGIEYNIDNNVDKMLEMGISNVPVLDVDGDMLTFKQAIDWINEGDKA